MIVEYTVLDHGFVRVVDTMGNDSSIVQAARVSYGLGTKSPEEDTRLIKYLMKNKHTSPFEMCEIKLHVKMPIFIARQWHRHRTASINEISGRYTEIVEEFYIPSLQTICWQSLSNKQGRGESFSEDLASLFQEEITKHSNSSFDRYKMMIDNNVAKELARIILPLNTYTEFYWKIDLHNLMHFLTLRLDPHAQWEIQQYAVAILRIIQEWVPVTAEAYRLNNESLFR